MAVDAKARRFARHAKAMKAMKTMKVMRAMQTKAMKATTIKLPQAKWTKKHWQATHTGINYTWTLTGLVCKDGWVEEEWLGTIRSDIQKKQATAMKAMKPMTAMKAMKAMKALKAKS